MRFLADAGISPRTVEFLRRNGHDVVHVRERALQRAPDSELIRVAHAERRIVLTFDLDFGEILALAFVDGPSVVIFRLADESADFVNSRLETVLQEQAAALEGGALITVEEARYRVRLLPIRLQ